MIPDTVTSYLHQHGVDFAIVGHRRTVTSSETAHAASVPGDRLAKGVVLIDGDRFLLAVIPASHHVDAWMISRWLGRPVKLAAEADFSMVFRDCQPGAVPPIGQAYGMDTIVDEALFEAPEVFFESGDHERVLRVTAEAFRALMAGAERGLISMRG